MNLFKRADIIIEVVLYRDIWFHYYSVLLGSDQSINDFQKVNQDLIWKLQDKF